MSVMTFTADVNKTVTVSGNIYTLTVPSLPSGVQVFLNEAEVEAGESVNLTEDMTLTIAVDFPDIPAIAFNISNFNSATINDGTTTSNLTNGQIVQLDGDKDYTVAFTGATSIPAITITGDNIDEFSVNSSSFTSSDLPYTFTPTGGITNSISVLGTGEGQATLAIDGTNIASASLDGEAIELPFSDVLSSGSHSLAVSGEIYQVDVSSIGGAVIKKDGVVISDGNSPLHQIVDIEKDTYFTVDGTHTLTVTGEDIKSLTINGVEYSVENLPVNVQNNKMSVNLSMNGFEPSEVHVVGQYMDTVTVDGIDIPIAESGSVDFELETRETNHFINIIGSQPREYAITWNDNGATAIEMDGTRVQSGTSTLISKDVFVEATPLPIPVHFESPADAQIEVNGREYNTRDFTVNISQATEVDVTTETCDCIIDYGDASYSVTVAQGVVTLTAPHRDGWIFDGWSSTDCGIDSPKSVRTTINLTGKRSAHIVCHYQRYLTYNKPNSWN